MIDITFSGHHTVERTMRIHCSRREFIRVAGLWGLTVPTTLMFRTLHSEENEQFYLYVGTYTQGESEGIYQFLFDARTGKIEHTGVTSGVTNPSYLAIDSVRRRLFAVNEVSDFNGESSGAVSAFSIDSNTGKLSFINQQPTGGGAPCYVTVTRDGGYILVANYAGGNVAVLPVASDGNLGALTDLIQHSGSGPNTKRQQGPHAHCIILDPEERYAFAADLGIDRILIYQFDAQQGKLTPNREQPWIHMAPGAGPRHITFHPNGAVAFVINELESTITALSYDSEQGTLKTLETVPALPNGFKGDNSCADIHVDPSGQFVYGSNRGHDSLVVYSIDERTGDLEYVGHQATSGQTPRNFMIDPTGRYVIAANQKSNTIVPFRIESRTGKLTPLGMEVEVPTPVCLKMIPVHW